MHRLWYRCSKKGEKIIVYNINFISEKFRVLFCSSWLAEGTVWAIRGLKPFLVSRLSLLYMPHCLVFWPSINQVRVCTACHAAHRDTFVTQICATDPSAGLFFFFSSAKKSACVSPIRILTSNNLPLCSVFAYLFNLSLEPPWFNYSVNPEDIMCCSAAFKRISQWRKPTV